MGEYISEAVLFCAQTRGVLEEFLALSQTQVVSQRTRHLWQAIATVLSRMTSQLAIPCSKWIGVSRVRVQVKVYLRSSLLLPPFSLVITFRRWARTLASSMARRRPPIWPVLESLLLGQRRHAATGRTFPQTRFSTARLTGFIVQ